MATVFRLLSKERGAEVFAELDAPEQETIINSITDTELALIIEDMYVDDAVDMMEELPANIVKRVMRNATPATRNLINQYLKYPDDSAGSIMTAEFVDLKKYMNVRESIARIRRIGEDKETIYVCYVTSADRKLEGVVTVKDLLLSDDEAVIEDIMARDITTLPAGRTRIDGEKAVVTVSTVTPLTSDKALFQRHDNHITLETDLDGSELFEVSLAELTPTKPTDEAADTTVGTAGTSIAGMLCEGRFALYLAGEPYKSGLKAQGCGKLKKAVFSIELDPDEEDETEE